METAQDDHLVRGAPAKSLEHRTGQRTIYQHRPPLERGQLRCAIQRPLFETCEFHLTTKTIDKKQENVLKSD